MSTPSVAKIYQSVIDEVIESVREAVLDEGMDEQVLTELKQLWEQKLKASKALEALPTPSHYMINSVGGNSHAPRKPAAAAASAPAAPLPIPAPSTLTQQMPMIGSTQVYRPAPLRTHQTQPLDMSGAATTATMALPAPYQQQFLAGNIQLQQTSTGITAVIPAGTLPPGALSLQPHTIQQIRPQVRPQNLSTKVQGQLDGADDDAASQSTSQPDCRPAQDRSCRPKTTLRGRRKAKDIEIVVQLDGADTSSDEDEDIGDDDEDEIDNEADVGEGEEEPLNSGDDDADADESANLFEMENVIVCQYDKITRSKNRWRFTLKDGIMNIKQRDYVFQKAHGEAEW